MRRVVAAEPDRCSSGGSRAVAAAHPRPARRGRPTARREGLLRLSTGKRRDGARPDGRGNRGRGRRRRGAARQGAVALPRAPKKEIEDGILSHLTELGLTLKEAAEALMGGHDDDVGAAFSASGVGRRCAAEITACTLARRRRWRMSDGVGVAAWRCGGRRRRRNWLSCQYGDGRAREESGRCRTASASTRPERRAAQGGPSRRRRRIGRLRDAIARYTSRCCEESPSAQRAISRRPRPWRNRRRRRAARRVTTSRSGVLSGIGAALQSGGRRTPTGRTWARSGNAVEAKMREGCRRRTGGATPPLGLDVDPRRSASRHRGDGGPRRDEDPGHRRVQVLDDGGRRCATASCAGGCVGA